MGKKWDTGETAFDPAFWREVLRVLKPGGHVVAFGGTRSYHRLVCAIEDAGAEIRDQLAWLYGSGFPKSHDVSKGIDRAAGLDRPVIASGAPVKRMIPGADQARAGWAKDDGREFVPTVTGAAWEGWGTALKPALEPICLARKLLDGTVAANVLRWGTGALNIDGCRVEAINRPARSNTESTSGLSGVGAGGIYGSFAVRGSVSVGATNEGRWPANVITDGSDEVIAAFPESSSTLPGNIRPTPSTNNVYGAFSARSLVGHIDKGSAARFFYSAKADGLDRLGSKHPTVKPVDLMRWLCRLVTPPGGLVLDPFAGSGSTGVAALAEGFDAVLIEREADYIADIRRRIAWARGDGALTGQEKARSRAAADDHGPLFAQPADLGDAA